MVRGRVSRVATDMITPPAQHSTFQPPAPHFAKYSHVSCPGSLPLMVGIHADKTCRASYLCAAVRLKLYLPDANYIAERIETSSIAGFQGIRQWQAFLSFLALLRGLSLRPTQIEQDANAPALCYSV